MKVVLALIATAATASAFAPATGAARCTLPLLTGEDFLDAFDAETKMVGWDGSLMPAKAALFISW